MSISLVKVVKVFLFFFFFLICYWFHSPVNKDYHKSTVNRPFTVQSLSINHFEVLEELQ